MEITIHSLQQFHSPQGRYAELQTNVGKFTSAQYDNRTDLTALAAEILDENGINDTPEWDCELPDWAT